MQTITTIGLDIAKSVFQVHGVDGGGQVIVRRRQHRPDRLSRQGYQERHARLHRASQRRAVVRHRALRAEPGLLPRPADGYATTKSSTAGLPALLAAIARRR